MGIDIPRLIVDQFTITYIFLTLSVNGKLELGLKRWEKLDFLLIIYVHDWFGLY